MERYLFDIDKIQPQTFKFLLESTYQVWLQTAAKRQIEKVLSKLPAPFCEEQDIGCFALYNQQGMENAAYLTVQKFKFDDPYDCNNVLDAKTDVAVFDLDGAKIFDGLLGEVVSKIDSPEFRFCFVGLKKTHHGKYGFPK